MEVKAGKPTLEVIKTAIRANQPFLLEGMHGIGKSEMCLQAARELGLQTIVLDLSIIEAVDLSGIPQVNSGKTTYAAPSFLPDDGNGLLVIEELNRAPRHVQSPALQLLSARKLNNYTLPSGWLPCACTNPPNDEYQTDELDPALLSRFLRVEVVPDFSEWQTWAKTNGIDGRIIEFIAAVPKAFKVTSPRSWAYANKILHTCESMGAGEKTLLVSLSGLVGDEIAVGFLSFSGGQENPIEATDVLERFEERKVLEVVKRWKRAGRLDLLESTVHKIKIHLQASSVLVALADEPQQQKNLERFVQALPGDLRRKAQGLLGRGRKKAKDAGPW